jgi:hypothetical protein
MNRSQKYISILLERLPKWELRSYEHQTSLDRIRDRISSASDIQKELRILYQVKGFADFALSLMWIVNKVEKDPALEESTLAEETLVFTKFRRAIGDSTVTEEEITSAEANSSFPSSGIESPQAQTPEVLLDSTWNPVPGSPTSGQTVDSSPVLGREHERSFANLLEKFLESVQSGSEDRTTIMSNVISECKAVISAGSVAEEYRNFCKLMVEFLQYISENQFLDDVRVMNIVSNIQDPVAQWALSEQTTNRSGLLDQAIDILRDFKTMFE